MTVFFADGVLAEEHFDKYRLSASREAIEAAPDDPLDDEQSDDEIDIGPAPIDQIDEEFFEEDPLQGPDEESASLDKSNALSRYWGKFRDFGKSTLTLDYEYVYQTGEPRRGIMNRSSMRLEWDCLFADRYYARFDGKITAMGSDDHEARARDELYRIESNLREAYVEAGFEDLTLRLGKQILIWGQADTAVITDLVSPRDVSELNFKSLEDSRVGQTMVTADIYSRYGSFGLFINPFPETDELPEPGTEYYVSVPMPGVADLSEDDPGIEDTEYGIRWKRTFGPSDIALMAADLVENQPAITFRGLTGSGEKKLAYDYQRFQMLGFAGNLSRGNFIWKGEVAYSFDRPYQCTNQSEDQNTGWATIDKDTLDIALGMEFSPPSRLWTLTLEAANKHIFQWNKSLMNNKRNDSAITGILSRNFLNETLNIEYTGRLQLRSRDTFQKLRVGYDISDNLAWILELGGFTSQDKEGPYWPYRRKERIMLGLKWKI